MIAKPNRRRVCRLSTSEMMTLVIAFPTSHYRTFKHFMWWKCVATGERSFRRWSVINAWLCLPTVLVPWAAYLQAA
ncbi:MAG: hypothetical protein ACJ73N_09280 [Bryobacteraceae bacterium]